MLMTVNSHTQLTHDPLKCSRNVLVCHHIDTLVFRMEAHPPRTGLSIFLVKVVRQRAGSWQPGRQRDEQNIFRLPRKARRRQPYTQMFLAADLQALGALYASRPVLRQGLMRGQTDAFLQWHALAKDRDVGHQDGLVGGAARPCAG